MRPHYLLDMDGVVCNFPMGTIMAHKRQESHEDINQWNIHELFGMPEKEFWEPLKGVSFWENLEPYPWAVEFYSKLKEMGDVTICTSPNADEECIIGKYRWAKRVLGAKVKDFMVGGKKYLMAKSGILIDDYIENVNKFRGAGGTAILFKQPWNSGHISYDYNQILQLLSTGKCD